MTALEPSEGVKPPDKGLQSERTSLSFVRTSLSILGLSAACLRWLPPFGSVALIGPSVAAVLVVAVTVYALKGLYLTSAVYAVLLVLCVQGIAEWRRIYAAQGVAPAGAVAS